EVAAAEEEPEVAAAEEEPEVAAAEEEPVVASREAGLSALALLAGGGLSGDAGAFTSAASGQDTISAEEKPSRPKDDLVVASVPAKSMGL
ncbi:MAG: hypothetical protein ACPGRX_00810, partial [Bdellovibrionales bacterium]